MAIKPMSLVFSAIGGALAGMIYKRLWKAVSGEDQAPTATDTDRTWDEVLAAAALHGLVFGLVKAAVDRAATQSVRRMRSPRTRQPHPTPASR